MEDKHLWWQHGIIYQIYPRSFMDSDGDGIGDLSGIRSKLEYLKWLGVDAVWLSPIYPSPMVDFGYDVSDYASIQPMFGSMEDFEKLLAEAHRHGLKLILDLVPNHTSAQHPWFLESQSSRSNPKRDWYLWREPAAGGGPPNNWLSYFGGSAWQLDEHTGQYYYHSYLKEQPDVNWRNPDVQSAMFDVLRFWLDLGVDGFRLDAIWNLIKDDEYRDNPPNPSFRAGDWPYKARRPVYSSDRPEIHEILRRMRRVVDEYEERVLLGEIYLPMDRVVTYYGVHGPEIQLPSNFQLILLYWNARKLTETIEAYETLLPPNGWPNWVLGNHDQPRVATRLGEKQARVAAMLLLTLRGTPIIYYGEEIGMTSVPIPPEQVMDPWEKNTPGLGLGRDPVRTPMQWDGGENAGFTAATPWLPVAGDFPAQNVEVQRRDQTSILQLYRSLIALRRSAPALTGGTYQSLEASGDLLAFQRHCLEQRLLVVLNLGTEARTFELGDAPRTGKVVLSTYLDRKEERSRGTLEIRGDEGLIVELER
jgi:alpha-glucosidase